MTTMSEKTLPEYPSPELYDLVYSWYGPDRAFYVARAQEAAGPVLEVGCGTGRILIPTLEAGVDIDGIDLREEMIAAARRKAEALGRAPNLMVADMRDFTMPRRYALVTMPFRVFQHALTSADQIRTLKVARDHLEPGGALVFNVFFPNYARLAGPDGEQVLEKEFAHPETGLPVMYYSTAWRDRVNQTMRIEAEIAESDPRGYAGATHRYQFHMRWTFRGEMELLLHTAGFARFQVKGGFDGRPLETDADEMVWTAWRD
jgi:SAM-dependent methyltransferase